MCETETPRGCQAESTRVFSFKRISPFKVAATKRQPDISVVHFKCLIFVGIAQVWSPNMI